MLCNMYRHCVGCYDKWSWTLRTTDIPPVDFSRIGVPVAREPDIVILSHWSAYVMTHVDSGFICKSEQNSKFSVTSHYTLHHNTSTPRQDWVLVFLHYGFYQGWYIICVKTSYVVCLKSCKCFRVLKNENHFYIIEFIKFCSNMW